MSLATTAAEQVERDPQDVRPQADSEANDLRELHLSATFLTPYSVAPKQNDHVWLTRTQEDYVDHTKQSEDVMAPVVVKKKSDMASMMGFQGLATGKHVTETKEKYSYSKHLEDYVERRDRTFFRTRDHFSEYAEAKARDPSRSKK